MKVFHSIVNLLHFLILTMWIIGWKYQSCQQNKKEVRNEKKLHIPSCRRLYIDNVK